MSDEKSECRIEVVVEIDAKGQIVLPKKLRERAGFNQSGKIALVSYQKEGEICCVMMIQTERLRGAVTKTLSSLF